MSWIDWNKALSDDPLPYGEHGDRGTGRSFRSLAQMAYRIDLFEYTRLMFFVCHSEKNIWIYLKMFMCILDELNIKYIYKSSRKCVECETDEGLITNIFFMNPKSCEGLITNIFFMNRKSCERHSLYYFSEVPVFIDHYVFENGKWDREMDIIYQKFNEIWECKENDI